MNGAGLPLWAAWIVVLLTVTGAGFALTGALGLIRLRTFYERVNAPTIGATLGMALILCGSMLLLSLVGGALGLIDAWRGQRV